ncbi:hypothetical protein G9A89_001084 [Geosiphon pyriformis]|nr:hypothetical protein G9A89_001084 [Geosiphon pyriformis]
MFHGPAGGFFSQRKRTSLRNVKHSGNEKNVSLMSGSGASVYSDVESLFGDDENVNMSGGFNDSLSDLAVNTLKTKHVNTGANFGSPDFEMDEKMKSLLPLLRRKVLLNKIWIDSKIIKTPVKVSVKKSFALDINLLAVKRKLAMQKTQFIRKIFSKINGFGGTTTPSKFEGIIRSMFTSSESMEKAALLARENNIIVNSDLKRQGIRSDQTVVIKKILMDTPKEMIVAALIGLWQKAVVEFTKSSQTDQLAAKWSFLIRKDSVCMAKAVGDCETWAFRDQYKALLFTLLVGTMAHNLGDFLARAGGKTCVINQSLDTGNRVCCAVVCFENDKVLESVFRTKPIFGGFLGLDWIWFGVNGCDAEISTLPKLFKSFKRVVSDENHLQLAKLYTKKNVVSLVSSSDGPHFGSGSGFGSSFGASDVVGHSSPVVFVYSILETRFTSLEHSLKLLTNRVSNIVNKFDNLNLVLMTLVSSSQFLVIPVMANVEFGSDMILDDSKPVVLPPSLVSSGVSNLGLSGSKILTSKVGCLESKLMALEALVCLILEKLDQMCAGLSSANNIVRWHKDSGNNISIIMETKLKSGFPGVRIFTSGLNTGSSGAGVAVIMNSSVAWHVSKIDEIPGQLILIRLLFKGKLLVTILGIYAGASTSVHFGQALAVNSLIASAINSSSFVVLGRDFNESDIKKSASLRKCADLGFVNSFKGHSLASSPTWSNCRSVEKVIDYIFVSENLVSALMKWDIGAITEFFNMDHKMISVSIGLGGLFDVQLNSICKQTNRDRWKFDFKDNNVFAALSLVIGGFLSAKILDMLCGIMVRAADATFSRHWFSKFDCLKNKHSLRFLGLELLVAKVVKSLNTGDKYKCNCLIKRWFLVDYKEAFKFNFLVQNGADLVKVFKHLSQVRKCYRKSKYYESRVVRNTAIRSAIDKHMENFSSNKGDMIRSILEQSFHKIVLNHLVIGDELVLDPIEIKNRVDSIMVNWTRERISLLVMSSRWAHQYTPLDYVKDDAFSNVINNIRFSELVNIILDLSDGKVAGLSVFAVGSIVKDALEKNREVWLVLQDMHKAYDSVSWWQLEASLKRIKMYDRFVLFFGNLHVGRINRVMTDFGLSDGYNVLDGLNQEEVFFLLLWRIFYDPLLCEVKDHEHLYGYRINTNFVAKFGQIEFSGVLTQHILDIADKFFEVNDIAINNEKTVAIPINKRVSDVSLHINRLSISIAKQSEAHRYLDIFLSTDGLSKPSLAKA